LLEHAGARVDVAANGEEAILKLSDAGANYDLVLMDVQMPVMDGLTATRMLREHLALRLPVLAMTAGDASEEALCRAAGMDGFIAKPIDADLMLAAVAGHARHAAPAPDRELFDLGRMEKLCVRPDQETMLRELVGDACAQLPADLAAARAAWEAGEPVRAAAILHGARGGAASIGAQCFGAASLALETRLRAGEGDAAAFNELDALLAQTLDCARAWLHAHP
jgi:CheY-like chemotaxis protein/HPt (histidine-containing phosphotransfer) domain-containing protein